MQTTTKQSAEEIILAMAKKHGAITRDMVLAEAQKKRSPLHPHFCWDDTAAAHEYRLIQAGELIRKIKVTVESAGDKTVRVRQFHHVFQEVPSDEDAGETEQRGIFVTLETALSVTSYRDQMLESCKRDMTAFRVKYSALNEVAHIIQAIDRTNI